MARTNPSPAVISNPLWRLWTEFDALERTVLLGGIYAAKRGYHNSRLNNERNWPGDYSIRLRLDRLGPADKASALDLTMSTAAMKRYTTRLDRAAKARDRRLFRDGQPVLREFIGTKDGRRVYCYDLAARQEDWTRDASHLWHIHLSLHRKFVDSWPALAGILDVLAGRPTTSTASPAKANPTKASPTKTKPAKTRPADWRKEIPHAMDTVNLARVTRKSSTWVRGPVVRRLQGLLLADGFGPAGLTGGDGRPDGVAGPATRAALGAAQKKHRTGKATAPATPDYIAGSGTWRALLGA